MAEILSLSKSRKTKARAAREIEAVQNRAKFGRTKAEKQRDATEQARASRQVEAHKREE